MEIFLSDKALQGIHLTSANEAAKIKQELLKDNELEKLLRRAKDAGISHVLCTAQPHLLSLFKKEEFQTLEISAVVPDFQQFVRDTSNYGTTGAALRNILAMPLRDQIKLGIFGLQNAARILDMKFEILMNLLLMAGISQFNGLAVQSIFLHPQITDLALSFERADFFALFKAMVEKKFHKKAGLITNNFNLLNSFLEEKGIRFSWVAAPFNAKGFGMNPDRKSCEETLKKVQSHTRVIADCWKLSDPYPFEEGLSYLGSRPFGAATLELEDLLHPEAGERIKKLKGLSPITRSWEQTSRGD